MIEFLQQLWWLWLLALAVAAWIKFAKHPTARGLRVAATLLHSRYWAAPAKMVHSWSRRDHPATFIDGDSRSIGSLSSQSARGWQIRRPSRQAGLQVSMRLWQAAER